VSRNYPQALTARTGITVADSAVPAAPEDTTNIPANPLPTGVWGVQGADKLKIDVASPAGTTGNHVLNVYAWNRVLRQWVSEGQVTIAAAAVGDFGGRLFGRAVVTNWCSDFVAVLVQTLATGGGSGAGTTVAVTACVQDK
jgi:hypothetical protein